MAPKRKIDVDAPDTELQTGPSSKRSRTEHRRDSLDEDMSEESSAFSTEKILFNRHGEGSSIDLPEVPRDFEQRSLATIKGVLDVVFSRELSSDLPLETPLPLPEEKIYRIVRHLCDLNMGKSLYDLIQQQYRQHIENKMQRSLELPSASESFKFLEDFFCKDIVDQIDFIAKLALYLDQTYCGRRNVFCIFKITLEILITYIDKTKEKIGDWLCSILTEHRDGADRKFFMESVVQSLNRLFIRSNISLYIEDRLFERSKIYHAAEADRILGNQEVGEDYIKHVEERWDKECDLITDSTYFKEDSRAELQKILTDQFVNRVADQFGRAFKKSIENENTPLLRSMYNMFNKVNRIESLRDHLLEYVKNKGNEIITVENMTNYGKLQSFAAMHEKTSSSYEQQHEGKVDELIRLRYRLESICQECFENKDLFVHAVRDGYRIFFSRGRREALYARLVAKYFDNYLRSSSNSETFESQVKMAVKLVKDIEQMALFVQNYAHYLGKRLLFPPSVSDYSHEREAFIISKLKELRSMEVISLDRMLQDIIIRSAILNADFRKALPQELNIPLYNTEAVNVKVLSQPEWPEFEKSSSDSKIAIPEEIAQYEENFQSFYRKEFSDLRDLHWLDHLGTWTLKAHFAAGEREIEGTKLQVTILMQFNEADMLSLEEIIGRTRISDPSRILDSLVNQNILLKESEGDNVSYAINDGFSSEHNRIKLTDVAYEDLLKEKEPPKLAPLQRYKKQVQAAIVRLMKTSYNKKLSEKTSEDEGGYTTHELFEIISAMKVRPEFTETDFKACIEGLISSKHIKRSETNPEILLYIP